MKRVFSGVLFTLLLTGMLTLAFDQTARAVPNTIHVPSDFPTIQEAINHANEGDIIFVHEGIYFENVVVNKTLTLVGENGNATTIDGNNTGTVVTVEADGASVNGFTIQNSGTNAMGDYPLDCGLKLYSALSTVRNATVENCTIVNNSAGIFGNCSDSSTIIGNVLAENFGPPFSYYFNMTDGRFYKVGTQEDIYLLMCSGSRIGNDEGTVRIHNSTTNAIVNCSGQILFSSSYSNTIASSNGSISLLYSDNNTVSQCSGGIKLAESNYNVIADNVLAPGESIEVPDQSNYTALLSCERNTLANNFLTNGSIFIGLRLGVTQAIVANENTIVNNTVDGGGISVIGSNNSITQNRVSYGGISLYQVIGAAQTLFGNNTVSENEVMNSSPGILVYSENNTLDDNIIEFNEVGIQLLGDSNILSNNEIRNNAYGLCLSTNNNLRNNHLSENNWSLIAEYADENDIDTTNTINGDPIYYLVNQSNLDIEPSTYPRIGYLGLVNCTNVTMQDLMLTTRNGEGVQLQRCTNCTVEYSTIKNTCVAILAQSDYTTISHNVIQENYQGIRLQGEGNRIEYNTISNNTIRLAPYKFPDNWPHWPNPFWQWVMDDSLDWYSGGIIMIHGDNSTIVGNNITANEQGILMYESSFNVFRNNSMAGNFRNFGIDPTLTYPPDWNFPGPAPHETSPYLMNDVDTTNTINGKPVYWWINRHDEQIPTDAGYVVLVNSTGMIIKNLKLESNFEGMMLLAVNDTIISNNTITGTNYGILITKTYYETSFNDTLSDNNVTANGVGFWAYSTNCTISHNLVDKNAIGIDTKDNYNLIVGNTITNSALPPKDEWILGEYDFPYLVNELFLGLGESGILLDSANNTVCYNLIQNNYRGIGPGGLITGRGGDNLVYHNNFINNTFQASLTSIDKWDAGYPSGGNYWSDYEGTDSYCGINQNQTGRDGIGDTIYKPVQDFWLERGLPPDLIARSANQSDFYPLMAPISIWDVGNLNNTACNVDLLSNSSISDFQFNGTAISLNVFGENDSTGFCRICIPTAIMNGTYHVFVNDTEISYTLQGSDPNYSYLYFSYNHSTEKVIVTPEFPSSLILPLLMITTLLAIIVHRRRRIASSKR